MTRRPVVLIADDESKIRRLVSQALEKIGFDVACAGDGNSALMVFRSIDPAPDLVILDVMMPEKDGFTVLDELRKSSDVPVILLSARGENADKVHALQHGADDYVTKPFSMDELLARIQAVLRRYQSSGNEMQESAVLQNGSLRMELASRRVWVGQTPCSLTDTEFRLLLLFMRHRETVLTHDAIVRSVWGSQAVGETGALRITLTRVRRKLAQAGLQGLIGNYSGVGYIMSDLNE